MDVGVRSSNGIYDPIRWVGNTGCPAKSWTKGGHPMWEARHKLACIVSLSV
jgi:hypothetical protein